MSTQDIDHYRVRSAVSVETTTGLVSAGADATDSTVAVSDGSLDSLPPHAALAIASAAIALTVLNESPCVHMGSSPVNPDVFGLFVGRTGLLSNPRKRPVTARSGCAGRLDRFVAGDQTVPLVLGEVAADDLAGSFDPPLWVERDLEHAT